MELNNGISGKQTPPEKKPQRQIPGSDNPKSEFITLPAITGDDNTAPDKAADQTVTPQKTKSAHKSPLNTKTEQAPQLQQQKTDPATTSHQTMDTPQTRDYLPEYRSQTNGLRELLSSIDPLDQAYPTGAPPFEPNLTETAMHIPHSRPGLPGSPDLPIGPTRWGLYLSGVLGGVALLFVSALVYSHLTSPTGINWAKLQAKTSATYQWVIANFSNDRPTSQPITRVAQNNRSELLDQLSRGNDTQVATTSRISTTAATPEKGTMPPPAANDIFISPKELEKQIRALEGTSPPSVKQRLAAGKKPPKAPRIVKTKPREYEQLVVIPAANIDPDMENQIFLRASSYLKQRDISSARMILQYAATLGSGISAMALAETYDPNYLKGVNLHGVDGSPQDARKWYDMAARLGIKEANARLTALK